MSHKARKANDLRYAQEFSPSAHRNEKKHRKGAFLVLAEAEGFEPPWACTQTVFKTASL